MTKIKFNVEDCFATMQRMQENGEKVNVILTSPPYNTSRTGKNAMKVGSKYQNRYDVHMDNMSDEEYGEWTGRLFTEFNKVLAKNGVILYNISYGSENPDSLWGAIENIRKNGFMIADTIIWKKKQAVPLAGSPNKLTRITEFVFVICRKEEFPSFQCNKKVTFVREDTGQRYFENIYNFIEAPNNDGKNDLNKATYSSELVHKLLSIYAYDNDTVYDPFMGTGTTAIGCLKYKNGDNNIICIGSEISDAQVNYSQERVDKFIKERNTIND